MASSVAEAWFACSITTGKNSEKQTLTSIKVDETIAGLATKLKIEDLSSVKVYCIEKEEKYTGLMQETPL